MIVIPHNIKSSLSYSQKSIFVNLSSLEASYSRPTPYRVQMENGKSKMKEFENCFLERTEKKIKDQNSSNLHCKWISTVDCQPIEMEFWSLLSVQTLPK